MLQCRNADHCRRTQSPHCIGNTKMPGIDRDVGTAAALKPTVSPLSLYAQYNPVLRYASTGADDSCASLQEGSISDKDFEELVLRLHEIQV